VAAAVAEVGEHVEVVIVAMEVNAKLIPQEHAFGTHQFAPVVIQAVSLNVIQAKQELVAELVTVAKTLLKAVHITDMTADLDRETV
jgi:hypothetical protein